MHSDKDFGSKKCMILLQEKIRIKGDDSNVSVDTMVQEKNITFPTHAKLHRKIIKRCQQIAEEEKRPAKLRGLTGSGIRS